MILALILAVALLAFGIALYAGWQAWSMLKDDWKDD